MVFYWKGPSTKHFKKGVGEIHLLLLYVYAIRSFSALLLIANTLYLLLWEQVLLIILANFCAFVLRMVGSVNCQRKNHHHNNNGD